MRPLVVLATMRPGAAPSWADLPHVEHISLSGLEAPETARLATIVARAALDADDAQRIHDRTEGNPLFIGETVRASIEDGTLELRDGRMTLVEAGAPRLPLTLRAVLGARIDGLDEPARDVLGVAAVVGIAFQSEDLVALLERPVPDGALERLVEAALVVSRRGGRRMAVQPPAGPRCRLCRDARRAATTAPCPPRRLARSERRRRDSRCGSPSIGQRPGCRESRPVAARSCRVGPVGRCCGRGGIVLADGR